MAVTYFSHKFILSGANRPCCLFYDDQGTQCGKVRKHALYTALYHETLVYVPVQSPKKVEIWDLQLQELVAEFHFQQPVLGIRLNEFRLVVCTQVMVACFRSTDWKLCDQIETDDNIHGAVDIPVEGMDILVCPGLQSGYLHVERYKERTSQTFWACYSPLACMKLCYDGSLVATSSDHGTIVRVFDTWTQTLLHQCRRGSWSASIVSLSFDPTLHLLACVTLEGSIHVWDLTVTGFGLWKTKSSLLILYVSSLSYNSTGSPIREVVTSASHPSFTAGRTHSQNLICFTSPIHLIYLDTQGTFIKWLVPKGIVSKSWNLQVDPPCTQMQAQKISS